jgi:transcriptional regulator with XRE-family HTH domain
LGDVHVGKFGYSELTVKRKVRNIRNDFQPLPIHSSNMAKIRKTKPDWFVREWLEFKGLRQKDLVSRTEYNKSQVSEWVSGAERWNRDVLYAFAFAIGVDASDLLKPPPVDPVENELAKLIVEMDQRQKARTLRLLRAMADESKAA